MREARRAWLGLLVAALALLIGSACTLRATVSGTLLRRDAARGARDHEAWRLKARVLVCAGVGSSTAVGLLMGDGCSQSEAQDVVSMAMVEPCAVEAKP